jgi:hypothetical protein
MSWSGQIKDYEIGICCFSTKHAALRRKSKDWMARNRTMCQGVVIYLRQTVVLVQVWLFFSNCRKNFDFEDNVEFKQVYKLTIYFYKVSILLINYNIKYAALRRKSKDWMARNRTMCQGVVIYLRQTVVLVT